MKKNMKILYNNFDDITWIDFFKVINNNCKTDKVIIIDSLHFIKKAKYIFPNAIFFDLNECIKNNFDPENDLNIINQGKRICPNYDHLE